ncbi:MAG TPA: NAD(P)H-hydrate dehydratase [Gammaproteobacteria bacterium]|nr:NAD(P)H-hydrate dehydratase [Gammaproteobacteria bacterium]
MPQLPAALYSAAQMRELDRRAEDRGVPALTLMTRAGTAAWQTLQQSWPKARHIAVFAGAGNNAGDGYVLATQALRAKRQVTVVNVGDPAKLAGAAATVRKQFLAAKGREQPFSGELPPKADVIVDALFGIGLDRPLRERWAQAVELINTADKPVLAVDIPSGLSADSGAILGAAVHASVTQTFIGLKPGLFTGAGLSCTGKLEFNALGVPAQTFKDLPPRARLLDARVSLPRRARTAHKGDFGHVLVIGGDHGMGGAPRLSAEAALRSGAGLVSVITRPEHVAGFLAGLPEAMVRGVDDAAQAAALFERASVIAVGPGLGQEAWGRRLFTRALTTSLPLVVDADALNLLAARPLTHGQWILTPHPGEAARLLKQSVAEIQLDRLKAAARIAEKYRAVVALKGAGTIVAAEGGTPAICRHGNPGMAAPGMGDVLTGIIAALVAQGLTLPEAARTGVQAHALAGDRAATAGERGLLARDLIAELHAVLNA